MTLQLCDQIALPWRQHIEHFFFLSSVLLERLYSTSWMNLRWKNLEILGFILRAVLVLRGDFGQEFQARLEATIEFSLLLGAAKSYSLKHSITLGGLCIQRDAPNSQIRAWSPQLRTRIILYNLATTCEVRS